LTTYIATSPGIVGTALNVAGSALLFEKNITVSSINWSTPYTYSWDTILQQSPFVIHNSQTGIFTLNNVGTYVCRLNVSFLINTALGGLMANVEINGQTWVTPMNMVVGNSYQGIYLYWPLNFMINNTVAGTTMAVQVSNTNGGATFGIGGFSNNSYSSINFYG